MALPFRRPRDHRAKGQSLAEFALVFPAFVLILFSVIEFAFILNAMLGVNFASREAALTAAEAGNNADADCAILRTVEASIGSPADKNRVTTVEIYLSKANGTPVQPERKYVYVRQGSMPCPLPTNANARLPYTYSFGSYAYNTRCNVLAGCGTKTVDTIGVEISYVYDWKTPLVSLLPMAGPGYNFHMGNAMRMEPVL
jgi:Flp pilus assembly protein TadG